MRRQQQERYLIPRGSAFRFLSSPNLTGEMVEWVGFALMAWSLPALAFALWTAANLIPRALWQHRWYRRTFPELPTVPPRGHPRRFVTGLPCIPQPALAHRCLEAHCCLKPVLTQEHSTLLDRSLVDLRHCTTTFSNPSTVC